MPLWVFADLARPRASNRGLQISEIVVSNADGQTSTSNIRDGNRLPPIEDSDSYSSRAIGRTVRWIRVVGLPVRVVTDDAARCVTAGDTQPTDQQQGTGIAHGVETFSLVEVRFVRS
jgi:hypothetical protein